MATTVQSSRATAPVSRAAEWGGTTPARLGRPIKILLFYQDFGAMGGIERYLLQWAEHLQQSERFEPILVCSAGTPFYQRVQAAGFTVYGLNAHPWFAKSFRRSLDVASLFRLHEILDQEKPDLVHVHIGLMENLLLKLWGYPVVFTFHGYASLYSMQGVTSPMKRVVKGLFRWLFRKIAQHLDALVFVSRAEQFRMLNEGYLPDDQTGTVIHNGVPVADWQAQANAVDAAAIRAKLGIPAEAWCVSYINRLDANKNPLAFIELAKRLLPRSEHNLHFIIAGDGPLCSQVQSACQGLPNVHVLGQCEDIVPLLAISDVVVSTARQEGFGLGLVEAMAVGAPCVAYASGGVREVLDTPLTAACLVPVDDREALATRVDAMLNQSTDELNRLKVVLQARALDFDSSRFTQNMEVLYTHLLPKISVILPVYNGGALALRAVYSVLNQTYPHMELIVVDDGSTDDTLIRMAAISDPRVIVIPQANQGVAVARNIGFAHARGAYIAFIDADDCWVNTKLAVEVQTIRKHTTPERLACIVYSGYYAVDDRDRLMHLPPIARQSGNLAQVVLEREGLFLPSTSLVHRAVFEAVGGFKPDCYHEDRVFFIEACQRFPAYATGQRLVAYRQSLSGRCRRVLQDYEQALTAELSIVDTLQGILPDEALAALSIRQMRNLLFRFLMYNYTESARRLAVLIGQETAPTDLFSGNKGRLALLSLHTRINFLAGARLLVQVATRVFLAPGWYYHWHTRVVRSSNANPQIGVDAPC